eukprot:gb/GFBE01048179.1/.p1 GENE.gb/GFBE01048179.1/~~gb/GFBE01048179.1/.p1  ORF type:complete len:563 (+),score=137.61 gb/GFBE01048179.1/:1-1689(+)
MPSFRSSSTRFARVAALPVLAGLFNIAPTRAAEFLKDSPQGPKEAILSELEKMMGSDHRERAEAKLAQLEDALRPTFESLPKNARGAVRPPAARYALHRLFIQRHAWQFKGLDSRGEAWHSESPAAALGGHVPEDVQELFEARLQEHGLDLHELAVLAATLENIVHGEADMRLSATFEALSLPQHGAHLNESQVVDVIDAYMASFVMGVELSNLNEAAILEKREEVSESYPTWSDTQSFLRGVQGAVAPKAAHLSFEDISDVVAEVGERYGRWQNSECMDLKQTLLQREEHPGTGRVRLSDFYSMALHEKKWQFSESIAYLRQLGALDESEPNTLRVIVPNYIYSASNCVASSGYYYVCCIDQCEDHLSQLELSLGTHEAAPGDILAAVNATLAPALQQRLGEIAEHHEGKVPLHGRLFAQWLHHVYPQDCPYPHMSGTTNPVTSDQLEDQGETVAASRAEMMQVLEVTGRKRQPTHEQGMCSHMWTMEEELVDATAHKAMKDARSKGSSGALRGLFMAAAMASTVLAMARLVLRGFKTSDESAPAKPPMQRSLEVGKTYAV